MKKKAYGNRGVLRRGLAQTPFYSGGQPLLRSASRTVRANRERSHPRQSALGQRLWLHPLNEVMAAVHSLDEQNILEARRGHENDSRSLPLEKRIQPESGAQYDRRSTADVESGFRNHADDGLDRIFRRRRKLADDQITTALIDSDEIGESAAGVNPTANLGPTANLCGSFFPEGGRSGCAGGLRLPVLFTLLGGRGPKH